MWSDKYYYWNIYQDKQLSADFDTQTLTSFLKSLPELEQVGDYFFQSPPPFPFADISLLYARSINSWSSNDVNDKKTNLIAIVCAKDNAENFEKLKSLFIRIATFINWQLVDEQTDEGIEDYILWQPKK
jgi:hypothetical protein